MLPPFKQTPLCFLRDFLSGKKELLKAAEVRHFNVPLYAELSVEPMLKQVEGDPELMKYSPVYDEIDGNVNRAFFYGVLGTLQPEYLSSLIKHANCARNKEETKEVESTILIREELFAKLESEPFFSSK